MKTVFRLVRIMCIFGLGVVLGFIVSYRSMDSEPVINDNSREVLKALTQLSVTEIPRESLNCEVNGTFTASDGSTINNDVSVGDFIADYLGWSFEQKHTAIHQLICEGNGIQQCTWTFGEDKPEEGWDRILRFEYNPKTKVVNPKSLHCIDVP